MDPPLLVVKRKKRVCDVKIPRVTGEATRRGISVKKEKASLLGWVDTIELYK